MADSDEGKRNKRNLPNQKEKIIFKIAFFTKLKKSPQFRKFSNPPFPLGVQDSPLILSYRFD